MPARSSDIPSPKEHSLAVQPCPYCSSRSGAIGLQRHRKPAPGNVLIAPLGIRDSASSCPPGDEELWGGEESWPGSHRKPGWNHLAAAAKPGSKPESPPEAERKPCKSQGLPTSTSSLSSNPGDGWNCNHHFTPLSQGLHLPQQGRLSS